jgi:hypothetical protein
MSSSQNSTNFLRLIVGSSSARMKKPTLCSLTSISISSTNFFGSRVRYWRQNFHCEQKLQVNGQPRAKFGMATRQLSGM